MFLRSFFATKAKFHFKSTNVACFRSNFANVTRISPSWRNTRAERLNGMISSFFCFQNPTAICIKSRGGGGGVSIKGNNNVGRKQLQSTPPHLLSTNRFSFTLTPEFSVWTVCLLILSAFALFYYSYPQVIFSSGLNCLQKVGLFLYNGFN